MRRRHGRQTAAAALGPAAAPAGYLAEATSAALTACAGIFNLAGMFRFTMNAIAVVLIGLAAGYMFWGSRVGNLTQSLNNMILEEDTLRARLASGGFQAASEGSAGGDQGQDGEGAFDENGELLPSGDEATSILVALDALKAEVQFQAKLIDQQSRLLQQLSNEGRLSDGPAMAGCRETNQNLTSQLQRCMAENSQLRTRAGATDPGAAWPNPQDVVPRAPLQAPRF